MDCDFMVLLLRYLAPDHLPAFVALAKQNHLRMAREVEDERLLRRETAQQRWGASAGGGGEGRKAETGNLRPERGRCGGET